MQYTKQLLLKFGVLLPFGDNNYLVPIMLKNHKKNAYIIGNIERDDENEEEDYNSISKLYLLNFKPPGLLQRIFLRVRGIIINKSEKNKNISDLFGEIKGNLFF